MMVWSARWWTPPQCVSLSPPSAARDARPPYSDRQSERLLSVLLALLLQRRILVHNISIIGFDVDYIYVPPRWYVLDCTLVAINAEWSIRIVNCFLHSNCCLRVFFLLYKHIIQPIAHIHCWYCWAPSELKDIHELCSYAANNNLTSCGFAPATRTWLRIGSMDLPISNDHSSLIFMFKPSVARVSPSWVALTVVSFAPI